jgi:membrane protease YdiL (CAAX protease family)
MQQQSRINLFINSQRQLRNGWWILIFFMMLAGLLVPTLLIAQQNSMDISIAIQAVMVAMVTFLCQLLRRKPLAEVFGKLNLRWFKDLCLGSLVGSAVMLVPALILYIFGWVDWQMNPVSLSTILRITLLFAGVAFAEEMLFRGFVFQRLIAGLGQWPAQLLMAGLFLLTHLANPGMTGTLKTLALINIFLASILFGVAFMRTKSLAMPLGLHFLANMIQGGILGFGVSGTDQLGLMRPVFAEVPDWLTGGQIGLEASIPGFLVVLVTLILFCKWKPQARHSCF